MNPTNQTTKTKVRQPVYVLHVRPLPQADDPRGVRRLRAMLKHMLRGHKLHCIAVTEAAGQEAAQ